MSQKIERFVESLLVNGCIAHLTGLKSVHGVLEGKHTLEVLKTSQIENMYVLGGVKSGVMTRAGDDDISHKNYFFLDFDIRNHWKSNKNESISDDEIKNIISHQIITSLSNNELLQNWRFVVFTGNGIHVYFFGDPTEIKNKRWWSLGVDVMIRRAADLCDISPDKGCKNVARISRMPGTYNTKHGTRKLVEIIAEQQGAKFPIEIIQKIGEEEERMMGESVGRNLIVYNPDSTIDVINSIPIADLVCDIMNWQLTKDGKHFVENGSSKEKACFVSDKGNFLVHGGTDHLPATSNGFSPFQFVSECLSLSASETFKWFKDRYPHVKSVAKKEWEEKKKNSFPFVGLDVIVERSTSYLDKLDPNSIFSYGYKPIDDHLGGIYPSEVVLIGGITGTGKTTWVTSILKHNARKHKVAFFTLEDSLRDYALKQIWFELGKIRKEMGKKNYPWKDFRNNSIDCEYYHDQRIEAEKRVKDGGNLIFFDRGDESAPDRMTADVLCDMIRKASKKGYRLFGVDHLHFFNIGTTNRENKADRIEKIMQDIKNVADELDVAIILIAHYKKLGGEKPSIESFKDSGAIGQTANVVINIWRDRSDDIGGDIYETHFMMPKVRSPVGEKTIIMRFNPYTFEYDYIDQKTGTEQELSRRKEIELLKEKRKPKVQNGNNTKAGDLPF